MVILTIESITKSFPGVKALEGIDLSLEEGKIYSLVGENGAGKSTLIKILMGVYKPDKGKICLDGEEVSVNHPLDAKELGMGCVFQEDALISGASVFENIFLSNPGEFKNKGIISFEEMRKEADKLCKSLELDIDIGQNASELKPGEAKMVEFARILHQDPQIIFLDEITSPLSREDVDLLFKIIRKMKEDGKTLVFISHRLGEVIDLADENIVLRNGSLVSIIPEEEAKKESLVEAMTGEEKGLSFPKKPERVSGKEALTLENFSCGENKASFSVNEGEIVALAGLKGQGQRKIIRGIFGVEDDCKGEIRIYDERVSIENPRDAIDEGFSYLSDKKEEEGLFLNLDVEKNIVSLSLDEISNFGFISGKKSRDKANKMVKELSIETPSLSSTVLNLSGGNKQKVICSRSILKTPRILLANQPALGLDPKAKMEVYRFLHELAKEGKPILTVLTELEEVKELPDRILVFRGGRIIKELKAEEVSRQDIISAYYGEAD